MLLLLSTTILSHVLGALVSDLGHLTCRLRYDLVVPSEFLESVGWTTIPMSIMIERLIIGRESQIVHFTKLVTLLKS